jgi:DNA-binding LytR/AlgR family response regulator
MNWIPRGSKCVRPRPATGLPADQEPSEAFSLLIAAIHMPGNTNGIEVASLMSLHQPALPIIYTTGRPDTLNEFGPLGSGPRCRMI